MTRKTRQQTYKEAIQEIEEIVAEIENETIDVDVLTEKIKRAASLIRFCRERLERTEKEVGEVLKSFEEEGKGSKGPEELF